MATQEYLKVTKYLAKGDNWKFTGTFTTDIPDIDSWTKKLYIQKSIVSASLAEVELTGSSKVYTGELTKAQSAELERKAGGYFIRVVASKAGEEMRTLTSQDSRLYIF